MIPIIAPDQKVFREVLGGSGVFIDPGEPDSAASAIAEAVAREDWRSEQAARAAQNLDRWNTLAATDRVAVIDLIGRLANGRAKGRPERRIVDEPGFIRDLK